MTESGGCSAGPDPSPHPTGVLIELTTAAASLPVVGRWLRPLAGAAAMGVWGYRHLPALASTFARSMTPSAVQSRARAIRRAAEMYDAAFVDILQNTLIASDLGRPRQRSSFRPLSAVALHRRYAEHGGISYGPDRVHRLDIWRRGDLPISAAAPVLLYFPGGGWIYGSRRLQAHRMLAHLAERGWVCLSVDYRVAPHSRWPTHIHDVKRAIVWAKRNVASYGGNAEFIALSGCSAGGHLASLAGLTANDPQFQEGFEDADTSVDAVVSIYGRYDWEDRAGEDRARFMAFLEQVVVRQGQSSVPEVFRAASPIARVGIDAPPFLVIHGAADTIIPVAEARKFVASLRAVSLSACVYAELYGAGHGFDLINNERTVVTVAAVERFLNVVRSRREDR
jgi:acetyl esterase/lipase